ncbi:general substrate transporter [Leucosporidium creatinivorum]|uniref:General substrate transporter n=1 Tax=Leucosporidium creatinivorum TaxID=106004 RepID=A0A1Y2F7D9_9BASI|nr:general substrate transporter [Leucosporidium creatinivorum]
MAPYMTKTAVYNWYASMVAAGCMVLYGYDASVFNATQGSKNWVNYFGNPTTTQIGTINSVYIVGNIVAGWFFSAPVSTYFGRRVAMAVGCALVVIATFVQTFAPRGHLGAFLGGRFIVGLGQGMALPVGPVYISEIARSEIRGKVLAFWQLFYSVGSFIAFWIAYATARHPELGEWDWKLIVIFQALCPAIIISLIFFLPESPRWYVQKGRIDDARAALRRFRDTEEEVETEILEMREAMEYEAQQTKGTSIWQVYKQLWVDKSLRWRMFLALVINAGQQLTGQGSLNSYSTVIYKKVFTSASTISLINALNATFGILFTLNAAWLVERIGRKWLLAGGAAGQAICMLIVALVGTLTPGGTSKSEPVGISIVFLLFLFILFYKPTWGATVWIWTSEVFSMNVRSYAVGAASQTQNVANIIVNQFFPQLIAAASFKSFFLFFGINIFLFFFVFFLVPETKGVRLEEMDTLFGGVNHINAGADILGAQSTFSGDIDKAAPAEHRENLHALNEVSEDKASQEKASNKV